LRGGFLLRRIAVLLFFFFALPVAVSVSGCSKGSSAVFCSGSVGPTTGTAQNIILQPQVGGISLGYAQMASVTTPTATDCKNNPVTVAKYTYATTPATGSAQSVADVNPTTGALCAGQWNRNSAGGVPDFTFCTGTNVAGIAELTASGGGANSNKVLVYVHPQITSIALGNASTCTLNANGTLQDPATNCFCGNTFNGVTLTAPNCYSASTVTTAAALNQNSCLSFNNSGQLVARFYAGDPSIATSNITTLAGHATYTAQTAGLLTFNNDTGVVTALAPGSTVVTANIASSNSTAGLVSVCPPRSITITTPNTANGTVTVNPNNTEPITAAVVDTNGVTLTGLALTYTSTTPVAAPASSTGITPLFPGTAEINVYCLPPACNPSPFGTVGLLGNGKPVISNTITSITPGSNSSRLWIGSTDSKYIVPIDLTTGVVPSPTLLPYQPNSMLLAQNGTTIALGSSSGLMTYSATTNTVVSTNVSIQGPVIAFSPDSATVVATDPTRKLIYLYNVTAGSVTSIYNGVATRAAFTPDGSVAYILTDANQLLAYSTFTGWQSYDLSATGANDVAVTIPNVGAFIGGKTAVVGRSYCPNNTAAPTIFFPQASLATVAPAVGDRIAATNDAKHLLDVRLPSSGGTPIINDLTYTTSTANDGANGTRTFTGILPTGDCPESGTAPVWGTAVNTVSLTGVTTTGVTGLFPASDSTIAFTTYLPATGAATTGAILPGYKPATSGAGTFASVTLAAGATAPVTGVFSSDNKTFFAGTAGDNKVHLITSSSLTDTSQLAPNLPSVSTSGAAAVPNLIVQYPRTVTNQ
jgi:hypothetical protein